MRHGQRTIEGAVYELGARFCGIRAEALAKEEAAVKRARGLKVRVIKINSVDYMVYQLGA
jgi:hypothetical protein